MKNFKAAFQNPNDAFNDIASGGVTKIKQFILGLGSGTVFNFCRSDRKSITRLTCAAIQQDDSALHDKENKKFVA
jgi:hypothetical protein